MGRFGRLRVLGLKSGGEFRGPGVFDLEREHVELGRSDTVDFPVHLPTLNRHNARFTCGPEGVDVQSLSDRNPVRVNGEPLESGRPRRLRDGDRLLFGGALEAVFEAPPGAPPTRPDAS